MIRDICKDGCVGMAANMIGVGKRMANFNKLIDGKLDPVLAFTLGKLKVEGDPGKALEFSKLLRK